MKNTPNKYYLARILAGWTQEELAEKAHINSRKTIVELEKGSKMSRITMEKINAALGDYLQKVENIK